MKRLALLVLLLFATPVHATVNEVFARNEYVVAGSGTVFPYTFKILDKVQITVMVNGVIKNLDTDYSVSGVGDSGGGAVTFAVTPGNGASVVLIRDQPVQQLSTYTANEAFPATRLMNDLDKNIMVDQMQQEEIGRALKFDPQSLFKNVFVDDPIAGQCLAWNASQTRVVSAPCVAGEAVVGPVSGSGAAGQVTFWTAPTVVAGDGKLLWDNVNKSLTVGTLPVGPLKPGNIFSGLVGPMNATGMQNLMLQTVQGDPSLIGLVTLGDDRVGISSWNFRGTGATNPIYGANFGVVFNTPGVANGLEIDVQNDSTTNYIGQALWLNGSTRATGTPGTVGHRANAILIDTQDGSKWERGILFKEGFIGGGATGSIEKMGIHFEHSQDADFIVIQPRVGASANIAFKLTNPEFTVNRFELLNSGAIRVGTTMTGPAFPSYAFVEEQTTGMYLESPSVLGFAISGPLVPGPGVGGFRRMTLGTALNIYSAEATSGNTGTINLWDQFSAHSVGLMAPDFVGNSFRIRLPSIPGISGQCLITDGAFPISSWSYAACGTGGGGGSGTVTNSGVLSLNALVIGNGGVDVKVLASLGTTTTVLHGNVAGPPTFGPVVVADIGATGTPSATTFLRGDGTWSTPPGTGTVVTSGTPASGQVAFMTGPLAITSGPNLTWGGSGQLTLSGVASVEPPTGVENSIQSFVTTTDVGNFHFPLFLRAISTGQMVDGFGPAIAFSAADVSAVNNSAGAIGFYRSGLDNTYSFGIVTYINGVAGERLRINGQGQFFFTPTPTVGTFGLGNNGTRRTELQFYANNGTDVVGFIAPATTTGGSHIWTLPSTLGAAGSMLRNDGTGTLSWVPGVTTSGTPASGQVALMSGATSITGDPNFTWSALDELAISGTVFALGPIDNEDTISSFVRTSAVGNLHSPLFLRANSTGQMIDGFGPGIVFSAADVDAVHNNAGVLGFSRDGSDTTYKFDIVTYINGVAGTRFRINGLGQAFYTPTPTVGTFGLGNNGTRRTELQFYTNNGTDVVSFIAPPTTTGGSHIWTLPSTFGAAGDVLTNTGGGVLAWTASGGVTGSGVAGRMPFFTGVSTLSSDAAFLWNNTTKTLTTTNLLMPTSTGIFTIGRPDTAGRETRSLIVADGVNLTKDAQGTYPVFVMMNDNGTTASSQTGGISTTTWHRNTGLGSEAANITAWTFQMAGTSNAITSGVYPEMHVQAGASGVAAAFHASIHTSRPPTSPNGFSSTMAVGLWIDSFTQNTASYGDATVVTYGNQKADHAIFINSNGASNGFTNFITGVDSSSVTTFRVTSAGTIETVGNVSVGGTGLFQGNLDSLASIGVGASGSFFAGGSIGLTTNIVVPCGTLVFKGGILIGKGAC